MRRWSVVVVPWLLAVPVGCGSDVPYELVPVSGQVTYKDGTPIPAERIDVLFNPQVEPIDSRTHPRQGAALVEGSDGTFSEATTWSYGDGVIAGRSKVTIFAYGPNEEPLPVVPPKYANTATTPLEVEVGGSSNHFELTVEKPSR
jgi:hypothetical protein